MANFVATGLFGDGAAAVVMTGSGIELDGRASAGPRILDTRSAFIADSGDVIGWNVKASGFEIVLSAGVADLITTHFPQLVTDFLASHDLAVADVGCWLAHPGGPRVLDAFGTALGLDRSVFQLSWDSLAKVGNLSSSSVLHVLADAGDQPSGTIGVLFALGPGVSAEFVLLEWP